MKPVTIPARHDYAKEPDGIQRGNEGIDIGTWQPSQREFERPTLPGEEHTVALRGRTWREAA